MRDRISSVQRSEFKVQRLAPASKSTAIFYSPILEL
jgi:hypothetical protein